jgi:glyoxylase I family protein
MFCYTKCTELPETATDVHVIGTKHFALGVNDIEEAKEFVLKNKIANNIEIKNGKLGKPYFFIKDPDGMLVEIIENG